MSDTKISEIEKNVLSLQKDLEREVELLDKTINPLVEQMKESVKQQASTEKAIIKLTEQMANQNETFSKIAVRTESELKEHDTRISDVESYVRLDKEGKKSISVYTNTAKVAIITIVSTALFGAFIKVIFNYIN